jgi:predicted transcriptional regulator
MIMSTLSVRLPNSLHKKLKEMADKDGVSMNQFITMALSEKVSALSTAEYFEQRAAKGSRERYENVLNMVADVEPESYDSKD